jgi:hypothetical protein
MNKSEFQQWLSHEATRTYIKYLENAITEYQDNWLNGAYTHENAEGTIQLNSEALGAAKTLVQALFALKSADFGLFVEGNDNA